MHGNHADGTDAAGPADQTGGRAADRIGRRKAVSEATAQTGLMASAARIRSPSSKHAARFTTGGIDVENEFPRPTDPYAIAASTMPAISA